MKSYREITLRKAHLSEEDIKEVEKVVTSIEITTNGEIACAITASSHNYSFWELLFSLCAGAIIAIVLTLFAPSLYTWAEKFFWGQIPQWFIMSFIAAIAFLSTAFFFLIANIPFIDRLITPKSYQNAAVYRKAMRHFVESGVYDTKEKSGILIFISLLEKKIKIIADRGISQKVDQTKWDEIASKLAQGFSPKDMTSTKNALVHAIEECGLLLKENFPPLTENPNELVDTVVILEEGE